jgi:hypothetical protein
MTTTEHSQHTHQHGPGCGHTGIRHGDHIDYVHDGHLHHAGGGRVYEHRLEVADGDPQSCTPGFRGAHESGHQHGLGCGHEAVPHGDHTDYIVEGRLHHTHDDHCDDHGAVTVVQPITA